MICHRGGDTIGTFVWDDDDVQKIIYVNGYPYDPYIYLSLNINQYGSLSLTKEDIDTGNNESIDGTYVCL